MKNMLIVTSMWNDIPTFRLIPVDSFCPFIECIFDTESQVLVIFSKQVKQSFHMVPKLNESGDPIVVKKPRMNGKSYMEERRVIDTFHEFYITEKEEILDFIKDFATNSDTFDTTKYIKAN